MTPSEAKARIVEMAKRPEMWAFTIESYMMQVGVLLEVCGLPREAVHKWLTKVGSPRVNNFLDQVTPRTAQPITASALQLLEPKDN